MPIHLEPPGHDPRGPDGLGWNRMSIAQITPGAQCALRPHSYSHMWISMTDTRRATWGGYGACIQEGDCDTCPLLRGRDGPQIPESDTWCVRIHDHNGAPYLMNRPDGGWYETALRWEWTTLANAISVDGWDVGPLLEDQHGRYFTLTRPATK